MERGAGSKRIAMEPHSGARSAPVLLLKLGYLAFLAALVAAPVYLLASSWGTRLAFVGSSSLCLLFLLTGVLAL